MLLRTAPEWAGGWSLAHRAGGDYGRNRRCDLAGASVEVPSSARAPTSTAAVRRPDELPGLDLFHGGNIDWWRRSGWRFARRLAPSVASTAPRASCELLKQAGIFTRGFAGMYRDGSPDVPETFGHGALKCRHDARAQLKKRLASGPVLKATTWAPQASPHAGLVGCAQKRNR